MSGGSYGYLCWADDLADLLDKRGHLAAMADTLARLGCAPDAAAETQALLEDIRAAEVRAQVAADRLGSVWKAVEWHESGDWGERSIGQALAAYRGGKGQVPSNQPQCKCPPGCGGHIRTAGKEADG